MSLMIQSSEMKKPGLPTMSGLHGTAVGILTFLAISGGPLYGQGEISNDRLIAGIVAHDSQIRDLELAIEERIGAENDKPVVLEAIWRHKGDLRYYREAGGPSSWDHSYDGHESRVLARGQTAEPAGIIRREEPAFVDSSQSFLVAAGRRLLGRSLAERLEQGTARVRPEPQEVDGHSCWVVEVQEGDEGMPPRTLGLCWLDPSCGFMPRRIEKYGYGEGDAPIRKIITSDLQLSQVSPGIWLPMSSRHEVWDLKDGQWTRVTLNLRKVTRAAVNTGLRDEDLRVEFPPGTVVRDYPRPGSEEYEEYLITAEGKVDRRGLDDLVRQAKAASGAGPAVGVRHGEGRVKWVIGGLLIAAGIGGMVFGIVRARSRSASSPRTKA